MKLKDKISGEGFTIEYLALEDGYAILRKKAARVNQTMYVLPENIISLLKRHKIKETK